MAGRIDDTDPLFACQRFCWYTRMGGEAESISTTALDGDSKEREGDERDEENAVECRGEEGNSTRGRTKRANGHDAGEGSFSEYVCICESCFCLYGECERPCYVRASCCFCVAPFDIFLYVVTCPFTLGILCLLSYLCHSPAKAWPESGCFWLRWPRSSLGGPLLAHHAESVTNTGTDTGTDTGGGCEGGEASEMEDDMNPLLMPNCCCTCWCGNHPVYISSLM
eukprot:TRINITY_DN3913_c0_g1_i1.p1 TRINITY_DN3913_c0_g1~~TRINITY_DN3913_c0_g1_i1.p1  ORF type:complete len:224 (+),score=39.50 TRINITY_DN3913_c0_g1_i1:394-1065(+)